MDKSESLESFYQRKFDWVPETLRNEIGHFNVMQLEPFVGPNAKPAPYRRRDYYKITLAVGQGRIHFADKMVEVKKQALVFSSPLIPYKWERTDRFEGGYFCLFNQLFFRQFGDLGQYSVFHPKGSPVFELTDEQLDKGMAIFQRMLDEFNSDYIHKYDALRNLVYEILHFAMKMQPSSNFDKQRLNASQRIAGLFVDLLERQFPVDDPQLPVMLRSASDFAANMGIHVNHLNKAIKEITQKTTSQIIAERLLQEAKILLKHSTWNVSEIAYALGFTEVTHFNNFFKKHTDVSPLKFRNN